METAVRAKIKVVGVGGGGGNALRNMIQKGLKGVEFIAANTDYQVLDTNPAPVKIQLGKTLTNGLGAGGNPEVGREAALEAEEEIREALEGADMVFITAGLGGGTGTGAAPVIARISRELGALTVAVVTKPFSFEGKVRRTVAEAGLEELRHHTDTVITIPNDRIFQLASPKANFMEMFLKVDDVLYYAVRGISDLILREGYINLDFADIKAVMSNKGGLALMGTGVASGDNRAKAALEGAISSPLLEDISVSGAKSLLMNITADPKTLIMEEVIYISETLAKEVGDEAEIFWGVVFDEEMEEELRVTVIATGIGEKKAEPEVPESELRVITPSKTVGERIKRRQRLKLDSIPREDELEIPTFLRQKAD